MKTTTYTGIDYSPIGSSTNRDSTTGIRYGVISQHSLMPEALDDVFTNGTDLTHTQYVKEAKEKLRNAITGVLEDYIFTGANHSDIESATDDAWNTVEQAINDAYDSGGESQHEYECDGVKLGTCLQSDLFITASPFYTYAQFCSPCVPGACNLDSPLESPVESNKCYCLGHDWFDNGKAPYPVYSVATGELVNPA